MFYVENDNRIWRYPFIISDFVSDKEINHLSWTWDLVCWYNFERGVKQPTHSGLQRGVWSWAFGMVSLDHFRLRCHRCRRARGKYRVTWRRKTARLGPTRTSRRIVGTQLSQAWDVSGSGAVCGDNLKEARGLRSRRRTGGGADMSRMTTGTRIAAAQDRGDTDSDGSTWRQILDRSLHWKLNIPASRKRLVTGDLSDLHYSVSVIVPTRRQFYLRLLHTEARGQ